MRFKATIAVAVEKARELSGIILGCTQISHGGTVDFGIQKIWDHVTLPSH
jgi:hypothetical protein